MLAERQTSVTYPSAMTFMGVGWRVRSGIHRRQPHTAAQQSVEQLHCYRTLVPGAGTRRNDEDRFPSASLAARTIPSIPAHQLRRFQVNTTTPFARRALRLIGIGDAGNDRPVARSRRRPAVSAACSFRHAPAVSTLAVRSSTFMKSSIEIRPSAFGAACAA